MKLTQNWQDVTFIGFDLETSGKYPLQAEICEMAAVKWRGGVVIDQFESLLKTSEPMSEEVIKIHNISNEMLIGAPTLKEKLPAFLDFIKDGLLVAHHSPFDMGFLAVAIEHLGLSLPMNPVFCSSLLARKKIPESPNHRLQTLVKKLSLNGGQAHRALDDARVCLEVALECFRREGESASVEQLFKIQGGALEWQSYSMQALRSQPHIGPIIEAIEAQLRVEITYEGGSRPGQARTVWPVGLVRNPNGDFLVAQENQSNAFPKRYFLKKISAANLYRDH